MSDKTFSFYGELRNETDKCWFVFDGIESIAIPKSQAEVQMVDQVNAQITIPIWMARKKGIM